MTTRIAVAGLLGAIVMFMWNFVAHTFLPLAETGVREIPNEQLVTSAFQTNLGDKAGLYLFPGLGIGENATRKQKNDAMKSMDAKYASNPSGLLVYHPPGKPFQFGKHLTIEFITEVIEVFLAVFLLAQTSIAGFGGRVGFVFVAGIFGAIVTNIPYWNWYGFPANYTIAYMFTQIIGFLCAGIAAALVLGRRSSAV